MECRIRPFGGISDAPKSQRPAVAPAPNHARRWRADRCSFEATRPLGYQDDANLPWATFRPSNSPDLRANVTCAWLKAKNAKIEQELANNNETAAQSSNPTKNPTTVVGVKGKRLKLGRD
jgi:hypothetical protein